MLFIIPCISFSLAEKYLVSLQNKERKAVYISIPRLENYTVRFREERKHGSCATHLSSLHADMP